MYWKNDIQRFNAAAEDGKLIRYMINPPEQTCLHVVRINGELIKYIKNPSENVMLQAIQNNYENLAYISNPTDNVIISALMNNTNAIFYVKTKEISKELFVRMDLVMINHQFYKKLVDLLLIEARKEW